MVFDLGLKLISIAILKKKKKKKSNFKRKEDSIIDATAC